MRQKSIIDRSVIVLFALQVPLLAEFARRFISPGFYWLLVSDIIMFFTVFFVAYKTMLKYWGFQLSILLALLSFAFFSVAFNDLPVPLIYVGNRPFIMGVVSAILGHYYVQGGRGFERLLWVALFWSALITAYAILQLVLGIGHPINKLPSGVENNFDEGIGGYTEHGSSFFGLFRPTSIFFHTGKFGQVAYFMGLVPMLFLFSKFKTHSMLLQSLAGVGFIAILISGQRASMLFTLIAVGIYLLKTASFRTVVRAVSIGLVILAIPLSIGGNDMVVVISDRYADMDQAAKERLVDNSSSAYDILIDSGFIGQGVGVYSFGAGSFIQQRIFVTEHAWLRLLAEWGVFGFVIVVFFLLSVVHVSTMESSFGMKDPITDVLRFASLSIAISLAVWSFTHDVLGNTLTMQIAFTVLGATRGRIACQAYRRFADRPLRSAIRGAT